MRWTFVRGAERCAVDVEPAAVSRDGIGVVDALLGACGVGRPFEVSVRHWLQGGQLQPVCEPWTSEPQPINAVLPFARAPSAKVRLYLEHVRRTLLQK